MKKEFTKTGNFESFKMCEMNREKLKKIQGGGRWILINGVWVWIEDEDLFE